MGNGNLELLAFGLDKIAKKLSVNQVIGRLLCYSNIDPLSKEKDNLKLDEVDYSILGKNIKLLPKVDLTKIDESFITVLSPYGTVNPNDNFSTVTFEIDVVVPIDLWPINDECCLRPFKIMSEIKKTINKTSVTGIGVIEFSDYSLDIPSDEISVYKMIFVGDING